MRLPFVIRRAGALQSRPLLSRFWRLAAHLFHHLPHGSDVAGRPFFDPGFVALRCFLEMSEEEFILEAEMEQLWFMTSKLEK